MGRNQLNTPWSQTSTATVGVERVLAPWRFNSPNKWEKSLGKSWIKYGKMMGEWMFLWRFSSLEIYHLSIGRFSSTPSLITAGYQGILDGRRSNMIIANLSYPEQRSCLAGSIHPNSGSKKCETSSCSQFHVQGPITLWLINIAMKAMSSSMVMMISLFKKNDDVLQLR